MLAIFRVLEGQDDQTMYSWDPDEIEHAVNLKLNELSDQGYEINSVGAVPDYHHYGSDGGVKDIVFLCSKSNNPQGVWHTMLIDDAENTLHGHETAQIVDLMSEKVQEISGAGCHVKHFIMLTDHHESAALSGVGGYDGVKNVILCYQQD